MFVNMWKSGGIVEKWWNCGKVVELWKSSGIVEKWWNCGKVVELWKSRGITLYRCFLCSYVIEVIVLHLLSIYASVASYKAF